MTQLANCRTCCAAEPYMFLPLGEHPPANMFIRPEEIAAEEPRFSLDTQVCLECGLIQVADQIPPDFFRHYLYVPSGAQTMHGHFDGLAKLLRTAAHGGLIVDVGCNDGLLLAACNALGCKTLGIDPAANIAAMAAERGVKVHIAYFDETTAAEVKELYGPASVIVTTNTFNHIGDLHAFMDGVMVLLAPAGTFVVEVPWATDLLQNNEFDTVYQEHVSEFSLRSLEALGHGFGLVITDVHRLSVHGGSMRVFFQRSEVAQLPTAEVAAILGEERAAGMQEPETYDNFAARIEGVRTELIAILDDLKGQGLKIAGYGAPAKGNTLLNYFGIGTQYLDFLVDRNPLKQGLYSPGTKIPIKSTDAIATERPDIMLVLAWNFFDEIREQQKDFLAAGGRFLVPLPTPMLVG